MMASIAEMLRHYGFKTMRDFMIAHGIYDLDEAKRMLVAMYDAENK